MPMHEVAQGETLLTIANQYGFGEWEKIYNHPENANLRSRRPNPMVLCEGDRVFVPEKETSFPCRTLAKHRFRVRRLECHFSVYLRDECGEPYADCRYNLVVEDELFEGKVGPDGLVSHEVGPTAQTGRLVLWPDPDAPDEMLEWQIQIGHLDPVDTVSGAQARLNNLGYNAGPVTGTMNEATETALKAFQGRIGMDVPTGELDDMTCQALLAAQNDL